MTSNYPSSYDTFSDKVDNVTDVKAVDVNTLQDCVEALEQTLGLNVNGQTEISGWSLADRLNVSLNANGTFKENILNSSDIPINSITNTKIYNDDTFEFNQVKVGKHADGSYGYTGSGPGSDAGVTIDSSGNVWIDGNLNILGSQTTSLNETITKNLTVNGNTYLGNESTDIVQVTGVIQPAITSLYNIGTPTKRFRTAYIDTVLGQSTGGSTLTVGVSAIFDNTITIKSSTDLSSGDSLAFIGIKDNDLAIQAAASQQIRLQPYGGAVMLPRMTTTERNVLPLTAGLIIYNTTTQSLNFCNGSTWIDPQNYSA